MPFYSPRGLKIRLDQKAIDCMIDQSGLPIDLENAFGDLELWSRLPSAMFAVTAIVAGLSTHSIMWTIAGSVTAFGYGYIVQQFTYVPFLRIAFPQILGAWFVAAPASILCAAYLTWMGNLGLGIAIVVAVISALSGAADLLLFAFFPIRVLLRRLRIVLPIGDMELAFMSILNLQASRQGSQLDWSIYDEEFASRLS